MDFGLLQLGEVMLRNSERKLETVSRNVANSTATGFKAEISFEDALSNLEDTPAASTSAPRATNFTQGQLRETGRSLDLAISGEGFFRVRDEERVFYTRAGEFDRSADGRLVTPQGMALQSADGGDLILQANAQILEDGVILEDGLPIARIGVFRAADEALMRALGGALFSAPDDAMSQTDAPFVRQGMLEGANVDLATEMVGMMTAVRQAEIGARVVQAYDTLVGQSISTFGRVPR